MLLLLVACTQEKVPEDQVITDIPTTTDDSGTTTEPIEDLGDPYLAMVASVPRGILSTTCIMRMDLYAGETNELTLELNPALGGEWAGAALDGGVQYHVSAYHSDCTQQTGEATIESGTFSGVAGLLFVYWFNGTNAGVESLVQTEDFAGGSVTITLAAGTPSTELETIGAAVGATVAPGKVADTYVATFPTDTPVGLVLAQMSVAAGFLEGSPDWISQPNWW